MDDNRASLTAMITAYSRAYHATHDRPKLFDDFLAHDLFTEEERTFLAANLAELLKFTDPERAASCPDQATALAWVMRTQTAPVTLSRSRFTEESLEAAVERGVKQYVILGAGLDTFAFRRPDLAGRLTVFEVDHPATQSFKRQRLSELGWEVPSHLHFVPVDFAQESLPAALKPSPYDPALLSFFSLLGVTHYLTRDQVLATLRAVADLAPAGSTIVFDYQAADALDPRKAEKQARLGQQVAGRVGEPMTAGFDPSTLAASLSSVGWRLEENLGPAEIEARFFKGGPDGYHAFPHAYFARAIKPAGSL